MQVSARGEFIATHRQAERALQALFNDLAIRIAGIVEAASTGDGAIPIENVATLRTAILDQVGALFTVSRPLSVDQRGRELAHLQALIDVARQQLRGATAKQIAALTKRIAQLIERRAVLLATGRAPVSFDSNDNPLTPYAGLLLSSVASGIAAGLAVQAGALASITNPATYQTLSDQRTGENIPDLAENSFMQWSDPRGYDTRDRIWAIGELIKEQIGKIFTQARLVSMASKALIGLLKRALSGAAKNNAVYGAKALLRGEITRMFGVTMREGARSMPVRLRVRWRVSPWHDPQACDGSCDKFLAESKANDGFDPDSAPIPVKDTHGYCRCDIYYQVGNRQIAIDSNTLRLKLTPASPYTKDYLLYGRIR